MNKKAKLSMSKPDLIHELQEIETLNRRLVRRELERQKTEEALRESEERFRALYENSHAIMMIIDPHDGLIIDANSAASAFYGYPNHVLVGMNINTINVLSKDEVTTGMHQANTMGRNHFNFCHRLSNGEIRDVEVFSGPVAINENELLYSIIHDITEKSHIEDQLRRYERIISSSPDLISLVDRNYRYQLVNDSYCKLFEKKREDLLGNHIQDTLGKELFKKRVKPFMDRAFQGKILREENLISIPKKEVRHFSLSYHPVYELDGSILYICGMARDITKRKQNEIAIKRFASRLSLATDAGKIGIWEWDVETNRLLMDDMMRSIYRIDKNQLSGTLEDWQQRLHPDDREDAIATLENAVNTKQPFEAAFRIVWPDGQIRHIKAAALLQFEHEQVKSLTGVNWDETSPRQLEEELRRLATTDALTGAYNRRFFTNKAEEEINRARRYGSTLSFLSLDIDCFKRINDTHGHAVGDEVLCALVKICGAILRNTDFFARMGGEEFCAILPETSADQAKLTAERLRKEIALSSLLIEGKRIKYTVSIGITEFLSESEGLDELMIRADKALYCAKHNGRNRIETNLATSIDLSSDEDEPTCHECL